MKKQELIHVHGLLAHVTDACRAEGISLDLEEYHDLETRPTSIQLSKTAHKESVFALTDAITEALEEEPVMADEAETARAD